MSTHKSWGFTPDHYKARVLLQVDNEPVAELGFRELRSYALYMLEKADEMERQRATNLTRCVELGRDGFVDDAARLAAAAGFTDTEINVECDRLDYLAREKEDVCG